MNLVKTYLHIPPEYATHLHGLRWSEKGDAIESDAGTFALTHDIAAFLEGFIHERRLIHFAHVLHLMALLRRGRLPYAKDLVWLEASFRTTGCSVRNVGAFAAQLCPGVPPVAEPIDLDASSLWVMNSSLMSLLCAASESGLLSGVAEVPPWSPTEFETLVRERLRAYTAAEVVHWFRHGRGPIHEPGEKLAREMEAIKPRSLVGVLAALTQRQRLAGAVPFVAPLLSALALPPRRLAPNELPLGGYTDVTTRGQPEHLLMSQFALDDLEFVRRLAARELLYFRREEPHAPLREELVLLLDQGVRCWGDVRLVLSAAVFALGRRTAARHGMLKLAATSTNGQLVDPLKTADESLGSLLEASDLSANPALALERVLEEPAETPRDVVLLTHPRSLTETDVAAAARRTAGGTRLFAVTVDDQGSAELSEFRHGTAVSLFRFRIDLSRTEPIPPPEEIEGASGWSGCVEPLGFPFRFGITTPINRFAFDRTGESLLVASSNGILHLHRADGADEVLPRGMYGKQPLRDVQAVLAVAGGIVVGGLIGNELVAMHYDLSGRRCTAYGFGAREARRWQWHYLPAYHSVVVRGIYQVLGVDLGTGEQLQNGKAGSTQRSRVAQACEIARNYAMPRPELVVSETTDKPAQGKPECTIVDSSASPPDWYEGPEYLKHDSRTGVIHVGHPMVEWRPAYPKADGKPVLKDCQIITAQAAGDVLALSTVPGNSSAVRVLRLLRRTMGTPLGEYPQKGGHTAYVLSSDGSRLARQIGPHQLAVHDIANGGGLLSVTPSGQCHQNLAVQLGDYWLSIRVGARMHLLRWDRQELDIKSQYALYDEAEFIRTALTGSAAQYPGVVADARPRSGTLWASVWYDPKRFVLSALAELVAVVDVFGHVALYSRKPELQCVFFVFRDKLAAWMPDGTCFGPASVTGRPATSHALRRIGVRLWQETAQGKLVRP